MLSFGCWSSARNRLPNVPKECGDALSREHMPTYHARQVILIGFRTDPREMTGRTGFQEGTGLAAPAHLEPNQRG